MEGNMVIAACVLALICGYFIGNVETAIIVSKTRYHDDIRNHGSGNAGTTNMLRIFGVKSAAVTFVCDFLKAVAAMITGMLILKLAAPNESVLGASPVSAGGYISAVGVILGHNFPIIFRYKGGKGVACSLAIAWLAAPLPALVTSIAAAAVIAIWRMVSLGALVGITVFTALTIALYNENIPLVILCAFMFIMIFFRHRKNIARIIRGEESKLSLKKKTDEAT